MKTLLLVSVGLAASGCYQKSLMLQAEAVSMTESYVRDGKTLETGGTVNEKWCAGDEPAFQDGADKELGLADQVIYKAQQGGQRADFITEVTIHQDSSGCAFLSGRLAKIQPSSNHSR